MTAARPPISHSSLRRSVCHCSALPARRSLLTSYVSLLIRSKIGRYIAMTMPPTMTPSTAIITGSISVSRPATAVSTSSS